MHQESGGLCFDVSFGILWSTCHCNPNDSAVQALDLVAGQGSLGSWYAASKGQFFDQVRPLGNLGDLKSVRSLAFYLIHLDSLPAACGLSCKLYRTVIQLYIYIILYYIIYIYNIYNIYIYIHIRIIHINSDFLKAFCVNSWLLIAIVQRAQEIWQFPSLPVNSDRFDLWNDHGRSMADLFCDFSEIISAGPFFLPPSVQVFTALQEATGKPCCRSMS